MMKLRGYLFNRLSSILGYKKVYLLLVLNDQLKRININALTVKRITRKI